MSELQSVVIGGGQAGLAVSRELTQAGVAHVVLEKDQVGQTWRQRWDSFCLVTPNWSVQLPGHPYDGKDADGFMLRDEVVSYLERYRAPAEAATLPRDLFQLDVECYRNPADLPRGPVLVIGSGQSGCQIAEELHEDGREVFLACGRAGWAPRRIGDHDLFWWLRETGELDEPLSSLPSPAHD